MFNQRFDENKEKNSSWYRNAWYSEHIRRKKNEKKKKDKAEFQKKMKWVVILSIIGLCLYFLNQWYFKRELSTLGVTTYAIVENIRHERYIADESGGGGLVDHYYVSYKFKVKNKWIHSIAEVKSYLYTVHLGETPEKGDTIRVRYLPESPKANELIQLK